MNKFSILIPVYNESQIIVSSVRSIEKQLSKSNFKDFEIILIENGSTDGTFEILQYLKSQYKNLKIIHLPQANFGESLRIGIQKAKYEKIILFNADWWDINFLKKSLILLDKYPIIIGSKKINQQLDKRPVLRKLGSIWLTFSLKLLFNYQGSDSHGLKAFHKNELLKILPQCITYEIIESEILIRASYQNLRLKELPVGIKEIRPARVSFMRRCFKVLRELFILKINLNKIRHCEDSDVYRRTWQSHILEDCNDKQKFHADDVDYNATINQRVNEMFVKNNLQSVSILVNRLISKSILPFLKKHPSIPVFLHFNLIEGRPLSNFREISSLVDSHGNFFNKYQLIWKILTHQIDSAHVKNELLSQIKILQKNGIKIFGIDSHQHIHALSPIAEIVDQLAEVNKIKYIRSYSQMQTQTILGDLKLKIFKTLSIISHLIYFNQIKSPISWNKKKWQEFYIGSWEEINVGKIKDNQIVVIHPGLNYDK